MTTGKIHVVLSADNAYFEGLLVTAWSIAANCRQPQDLVFHVIDGGISDSNWKFFVRSLGRFDAETDRIIIDQSSCLKSFGTWHGTGKMAYARLLLPDLLPNTDHIIYSDVDIIWLADISRLWDLRDARLILQCVPHERIGMFSCAREQLWIENLGRKFHPERYFCTGMLVMNLRRFRAENLHTQMIEALISAGGNAPFADQSVLNAFLSDREDVGMLESKWQILSNDTQGYDRQTDVVIHFAGDAPWNPLKSSNHFLSSAHLYWHKLHAQVREITVWRSLRQFNTPFWIVFGRLLYLGASNLAIVRGLVYCYLLLAGKRESYPNMKRFLGKAKMPEFTSRPRTH